MRNRALVLSGGGGLGAYQVGAISHLLGDLEVQHDIIVGTSVGAINGVALSMFAIGDEVPAAEDLKRMWLELRTEHVVTPRWLQPLSLLWEPSTHDVAPLRKLIHDRLDVGRLQRRYGCVSIDIVSGEPRVWTHEMDKDTLVDGIMSSSMTPIIHPAIHREGEVLYDGGLVDVTPARLAIDMGADELDIILTQSDKLNEWDPHPDRLWNTGPRVFSIMFRELVEGDLRTIQLYNALAMARDLAEALGDDPRAQALQDQLAKMHAQDKRIVKVRLLRPEDVLPMDASKFEPDEIRAVMEIGEADARKLDWGTTEGGSDVG